MTKPLKIEQNLWMSEELRSLSLPLLRIAERMIVSPYSMGLTRMSDDRLIWTNDKHIEIAKVEPEMVVKRKMSNFWRSQDLALLKQRLQQEGNFFHRYEAKISDEEWGQYYSRFEIISDGEYRLTTIRDWESIAPPGDVPILIPR